MQKIVLVIGIIILGVMGWFLTQKPSPQNATQNQIVSLNALEFGKLLNQPDVFVLDVHIPEQTHLPNTDAFIPYNELTENLDQLPTDKNTPIAVYCRSGSMSQEASQTLAQLGYTNIYDLVGGINAYKESHVLVDLTPASQDLGTVIYGDVATTEFTLTNFTSTPLTITRLSTSCGCTKATAAKMNLEPYEATTITVTFDPAVHKDDTDLGTVTRTIYLDTDNPNFDHLTAEIRAVVVKK
ncbi:MAG: Rhodanese domain protein [Candidatus Pacebacteria bacterium GW2011_GWB1_47_8]|nr:MAG: Rhodanese domain protein [Candidatus Pacebacteria bacterium GW2011_GWA1_46_10]KKU84268.1 MAG: Rhodanese domain protein [Candidatus Pacebacteria bacterium GW2011_GWB1_47_8]HCR81488.1 hypothetical protein [Candidatus Paceibacterota bacterium]